MSTNFALIGGLFDSYLCGRDANCALETLRHASCNVPASLLIADFFIQKRLTSCRSFRRVLDVQKRCLARKGVLSQLADDLLVHQLHTERGFEETVCFFEVLLHFFVLILQLLAGLLDLRYCLQLAQDVFGVSFIFLFKGLNLILQFAVLLLKLADSGSQPCLLVTQIHVS